MCSCICVHGPCTQDIQESATELGEQEGCKCSDVESSDSVGDYLYCRTYRKTASQLCQLEKSHPLRMAAEWVVLDFSRITSVVAYGFL